jgi:hypothetical protein
MVSTRLARMFAAIVTIACAAPFAGCSDDSDAKPVFGRDGRERWVVTFEGDAPDLGEYRKMLKDTPDQVPAYVTKMRAKQAETHKELDDALKTFGGSVVEGWWMSNQVTIEIPHDALPTIRKVSGVKDVVADGLLAP